jgi:spermidine synthase
MTRSTKRRITAESLCAWASGLAALVAVLILAVALAYWGWSLRSRVVFDGESQFGRVRVTERADGLRTLYTGERRTRQSAGFPGRPEHLEFAYARVAMLGLALTPEDGRILFVGLGGGSMPMYTRQVLPGVRIEAVEIDPLIVEVAHRQFGLRTDSLLQVHTGDGRAFIEDVPPGTYDLIVLDAFSEHGIPYTLATRQFLEAVRVGLAPGGVVVSNLWGRNPLYASMLATYASVFDQVHLIRVSGGTQRVLLAAGGAPLLQRESLVIAAQELARHRDLGFDLPRLVQRGYEEVPPLAAPVLQDPGITTP